MLSEARVTVTLDRVDKYAAVLFAKLVRVVAGSCWNHLFYSLAAFFSSLAALAPWCFQEFFFNCNSREYWAVAE